MWCCVAMFLGSGEFRRTSDRPGFSYDVELRLHPRSAEFPCLMRSLSQCRQVREKYDRIPWLYNVAPLGHHRIPGSFLPRCIFKRATVAAIAAQKGSDASSGISEASPRYRCPDQIGTRKPHGQQLAFVVPRRARASSQSTQTAPEVSAHMALIAVRAEHTNSHAAPAGGRSPSLAIGVSGRRRPAWRTTARRHWLSTEGVAKARGKNKKSRGGYSNVCAQVSGERRDVAGADILACVVINQAWTFMYVGARVVVQPQAAVARPCAAQRRAMNSAAPLFRHADPAPRPFLALLMNSMDSASAVHQGMDRHPQRALLSDRTVEHHASGFLLSRGLVPHA